MLFHKLFTLPGIHVMNISKNTFIPAVLRSNERPQRGVGGGRQWAKQVRGTEGHRLTVIR